MIVDRKEARVKSMPAVTANWPAQGAGRVASDVGAWQRRCLHSGPAQPNSVTACPHTSGWLSNPSAHAPNRLNQPVTQEASGAQRGPASRAAQKYSAPEVG